MAARLNPATPDEIVDLRLVAVADLDPLFEEEVAAWHDEFEWDFAKSAQLARRFVGVHALSGRVLAVDGRIAGYLYFVFEDHKALLGDLYILRAMRTRERAKICCCDRRWMRSSRLRNVTRIEAQLLMLRYAPHRVLPRAADTHQFCRNFMRADLGDGRPGGRQPAPALQLANWSDRYIDSAAALIAEAYDGHVDGWINDQYRSPAGAHRFLHNIVAYPGCGTFSQPASYLAFDARGALCGISLASLVSPESGHITQICVSPAVRGTGIGHALLRQSLLTLRKMECGSAGLTVTASNQGAVSLYERVGFRTIRQFSAYAWDLL